MNKLMNKIVIFAVMIIVASSSYVYSQDAGGGENIARPLDEVAQPADTDSKPVIYVHEDCPHCQDVEDFVVRIDRCDRRLSDGAGARRRLRRRRRRALQIHARLPRRLHAGFRIATHARARAQQAGARIAAGMAAAAGELI